jgi:hypothetical protein
MTVLNFAEWRAGRREAANAKLWRALMAATRPMSAYELASAARVRSRLVYLELDDLLAASTVVDGWSRMPGPRSTHPRFYMLAKRERWLDEYGLVPYEQVDW